jgi:hypothetical protein
LTRVFKGFQTRLRVGNVVCAAAQCPPFSSFSVSERCHPA